MSLLIKSVLSFGVSRLLITDISFESLWEKTLFWDWFRFVLYGLFSSGHRTASDVVLHPTEHNTMRFTNTVQHFTLSLWKIMDWNVFVWNLSLAGGKSLAQTWAEHPLALALQLQQGEELDLGLELLFVCFLSPWKSSDQMMIMVCSQSCAFCCSESMEIIEGFARVASLKLFLHAYFLFDHPFQIHLCWLVSLCHVDEKRNP